MNKSVKQAIGIIRAKSGLSRDDIAYKINRNPSYLSTAQKNPTNSIIELLKENFANELEGIEITLDAETKNNNSDPPQELIEENKQLKDELEDLKNTLKILKRGYSDLSEKYDNLEIKYNRLNAEPPEQTGTGG